jgi:hypothetical protein
MSARSTTAGWTAVNDAASRSFTRHGKFVEDFCTYSNNAAELMLQCGMATVSQRRYSGKKGRGGSCWTGADGG